MKSPCSSAVLVAKSRLSRQPVGPVFRSIAAIVYAIRFAHPEVSEDDATTYATALQLEAQRHEFDPLTGIAIIHHESRFQPRAVSRDGEDYGLAQVRARHLGACRKDRDPRRRPSATCRAVKESLLDPAVNIRIMAELITTHRKLCRNKAGSDNLPRWLASYQGRNSIKEDRWCVPGDGTHSVIRYRDRLVREVTKRSKELQAVDKAVARRPVERGTIADAREKTPPAPIEHPPSVARGG
jgi:hypothetical protein